MKQNIGIRRSSALSWKCCLTIALLFFVSGEALAQHIVPDQGPYSELLNVSGWKQIYLAFFFGFLSSLTPCVYPLIPVTLAIFGAQGDIPRLKAFNLSGCYVLGLATTYTTLGVISALTGALFGSLLGNPYVVGAITVVLILLALSSLDIVRLNPGQFLTGQANRIGGKGYLGAFLMGLVSGIIAAPCVGPVLGSILLIAGSSGDPIRGAAMLFSYSLGLGVIFIFLGTFSGLLKKIPRSGNWLNIVKIVLAVLIFLVTLFFSIPIFGQYLPLQFSKQIATGLLVAGFIFLALAYIRDNKTIKLVTSLCLALGIYSYVWPKVDMTSAAILNSKQISWVHFEPEVFKTAAQKHSIIMLDLYADWCAACKEFAQTTFQDARVIEALSEIITAKSDFTVDTDSTVKIQEDFNIIGLPTILFLDIQGKEIPGTRVTGFLNADEFLAHIRPIIAHATTNETL